MTAIAPLFSVIWYSRADARQTREAIAGLQAQTCGDFEVIVAEDLSQPQSMDLLRSAAATDARIKFFRTDSPPSAMQFLEALRKARGKFIAICPGHGRFLPDAFEFAAAEFRKDRDVGALCCRGFLIDERGRPQVAVDIVTLLLSSQRVWSPAGFLDRRALVACGLERDDWLVDALELDLWCRIATDFGLRSVDRPVTACERPQDDAVAVPQDLDKAIEARLALLTRLFSDEGFFEGANIALLPEAKLNQLSVLRGQLGSLGLSQSEPLLSQRQHQVVEEVMTLLKTDHRTLRVLHRLTLGRTHALGPLARPIEALLSAMDRMNLQSHIRHGYAFWSFPGLGRWLARTMFVRAVATADHGPRSTMFVDVYSLAGALYDARGQVGQALAMWERTRPPDDITVDSVACRAFLKLPGTTEADLAEAQRKWFTQRHLPRRNDDYVPAARPTGRKIRIGYHCAFMNSDTIRFIMGGAIAAHDRSRFEIYGYSPNLKTDITPRFDVFRHAPPMDERIGDPPSAGNRRLDDDAFIDLVRNDELDILVEMNGFSPGHRFAALSRRCAPVQINYLNHLGTSQVPNMDYVLTDEISSPSDSDSQRHYSEEIYRMSGCFLCYDYRDSDEPPVADPPSIRNGFVTFGYFGSGAKLNLELIELWARILHRVPGSKMHIQNLQLSSPENRRFMAERFSRFGIAADRLIIAGGVNRSALMRLYDGVDISLDTTPYCGGNTIAESLWQGVPVITHRGDRFVGAYGASLVAVAGCPELASDSLDGYVELAVQLANDPDRLLFLRRNLRTMATTTGLNDSAAFAQRLEAAYLDMLDRPGDR